MKKLIIIFAAFTLLTQTSFGQLNPINNLEFYHEHIYPGSTCPGFNCFNLSWEAPGNSILDTLIGFNIYRNNQLYQFQDYIGVACLDGMPLPCPDADFIIFPAPFWIKVTALYNVELLESIAIDSVMCEGFLININTTENESFTIYSNPAKEWLYIKQSNPNLLYNIELRNLFGQLVKQEKNIQSSNYAMNVADLKAGVYFYIIKENDGVVQQGKVIIK